jgi:RNA polymerase sigma factor (sigma-70 family)
MCLEPPYPYVPMDFTLDLHNNEQQFIAALVKGDRTAQKVLYETHYGQLMSVCQRYAGSEDEAMDLLHESFIKIFKKIGRYESGTALLAWMRRITVNTAIDQYRRNVRRRTEDLDQAYTLSSDAPDVFAQFGAREILAAVQKLPPTYRTIFNLYVVEGYSHREIGEQLKINESTSRSNLVKARGKLQKVLTVPGR